MLKLEAHYVTRKAFEEKKNTISDHSVANPLHKTCLRLKITCSSAECSLACWPVSIPPHPCVFIQAEEVVTPLLGGLFSLLCKHVAC